MSAVATRSRSVGFQKIGLAIGLTLGAVFAGFPALWMLLSSIKPNTEIFQYPPTFLPEVFTLDAYIGIFTNPEKLRFFLNSYTVALAVVVLTLFAGIMAGYALSRFSFPFKGVVNTLIISVQAVPPITLLIPYFGLVVWLRLYDSLWALILTYMVATIPYAILMMTGYFNTIPKELDEAVKVDGGTSFRALWQVLVPAARPGIVSVGAYTFMVAWNEFLFALTLTQSQANRTVPVGIQLLMGEHSFQWSEMMAMSVLGSLPVLILFLFFQRQFVSGITAGAVKA
ncbi:carbohydrate ABC transporter permease [uncultured Microbacterium sp.]|uniref:ABC transporter, permease protein n=1 Tax=uncultured Microbacterium sp. TaxID=191216 RepID=A0A1Y5NZK6_9MICO|nr:carbohydrate ABC transporter permease [uncultured Microbacterium sp.]SBS71864.1 ABC transporter, permease protein [uncultured Microbacterium sp.]